jgi:micrococcal nuclease
VLAVALLAGCGSDRPAEPEATVARVADGDTLELADGGRVRLVQLDAPELGEGECHARASAAALAELVPPGVRIRLERDPALDDRDRFGRLLRYVHRGDVNVTLELVRRGAAAPWFFRGERGRYADELHTAVREARRARRGLWATCPSTRLDPSQPLETGER